MKKTYFMNIYNLINNLFIYALFILILSGFFHLLNTLLLKIEILNLTQIIYYTNLATNILFKISIMLVIFACLLIVIDITKRMIKGSIWTQYKSVYYTISLRRFLTQSDMNDNTSFWDMNDNIVPNPVIRKFNKAIKKCVVDVQKNKVIIVIKMPRMQQAQKLLKMMESDINEEISSRHPNYYFSPPQRIRSHIWFEGHKRN